MGFEFADFISLFEILVGGMLFVITIIKPTLEAQAEITLEKLENPVLINALVKLESKSYYKIQEMIAQKYGIAFEIVTFIHKLIQVLPIVILAILYMLLFWAIELIWPELSEIHFVGKIVIFLFIFYPVIYQVIPRAIIDKYLVDFFISSLIYMVSRFQKALKNISNGHPIRTFALLFIGHGLLSYVLRMLRTTFHN